jgi:hypothetical protein
MQSEWCLTLEAAFECLVVCVSLTRMLMKSAIEEKIMTLQHKKNLMVNNVLGEGGFTNLLEKEDFDFLFDIEAEKAV